MPELPPAKHQVHPARRSRAVEAPTREARRPPENSAAAVGEAAVGAPGDRPPFADLCTVSNFSFLRGASHPDELVTRAAALGYRALGVADVNSLAGIVRAHVAAKDAGLQLVVGARLVLGGGATGAQQAGEAEQGDELHVLVYPTDKASYGRLCRLLTLGKRRAAKGRCILTLADLAAHHAGLLAVLMPTRPGAGAPEAPLRALREIFDDDRLSLALAQRYAPDDRAWLAGLAELGARLATPLLATNDAHCHAAGRQNLQDVLTCIRLGCTLSELGLRRSPNAQRHLKSPQEMQRLFADYPDALARGVQLAERAGGFSLDQLRYEYPDEVVPPGLTPMEHLARLAEEGARRHYPAGVPEKVRGLIRHELALIQELRYASYFLTVHDLVRFARSRGILCQGRGAAANSAVCFCLGVTAVDPERSDMLFERFVSRERNEPPDIDIDFEHERREEVIQYIYAKYGRERAALTAEVVSYRGRSAIREVGKAFGLSLDCVDRLAKTLGWWERGTVSPERLREAGLNPGDRAVRRVVALASALLGFPRHLSQHVGGFVITRSPLCELVPIENAAMPDRTVIEWDKDDIDAMGMLKVDVLGLGMLTCIRKALMLLEAEHGVRHTLASIPAEDPLVYDMICRADTVGVFQIESRAQMSMLPRLRPRNFYDLVIEISIVRPGPIVGKMVHPYLRRRNGQEKVEYATPVVERVLRKTLGVPLFQEQAMQLAIHCAGFTPGEAELLRRSIAAWKSRNSKLHQFGLKLVRGMVSNGYPREFAERVFEQIKGFSSYGFPESHAASFALLVYASAWLKLHYPDVFAAALLNSQPMGFYAAAQIVRDAQEHGIDVLPLDVNFSQWDCTLEERDAAPAPGRHKAVRLGLRLVKGLTQAAARRIVAGAYRWGPLRNMRQARQAGGAPLAALRALAAADAFGSLGLDRQAATWQLQGLRDAPLPLLDGLPESEDGSAARSGLPPLALPTKVVADYASIGLSLKAHPLTFIRDQLARRRVTCNIELKDARRWPAGRVIRVAGLVLVRQRPSTANGVLFMTIEDETGVANLIVRPQIFERYRRAVFETLVVVTGRVERQGEVVHVLASRIEGGGSPVSIDSRDFH